MSIAPEPADPPLSGAVLVTGGTGFIGRHLVRRLLREGRSVTLATRNPSEAPAGARVVAVGPIDGGTDWSQALTGVSAAVHLAGMAHRRAARQADMAAAYQATNADGTAALARAASDAGVRKLVFISSIAVNGSVSTCPFSADDTPDPQTVYGRSKLAAEQALERLSARSPALSIDVIRPPMVLGPDAPGNLALLAAAIRRGIPLPFGSVRNRRMFLPVDNLVDFIVLRLGQMPPGLRRFLLANPESLSTAEVAGHLAAGLGRPAHNLPFPPRAMLVLLKLLGRTDMAQSLLGDLEMDVAPALATGWLPRQSVADCLRLSPASAHP